MWKEVILVAFSSARCYSFGEVLFLSGNASAAQDFDFQF